MIEEWLYYNFELKVFTQRNSVADFIRLKLNYIFKKQKQKSLCEPPFGGLRGNVRAPCVARWNVVDFLFVIIERGRYLLRLIVFSCGINISAVRCVVLSQSRGVTDRRTELRPLIPRWHSCLRVRRVKNLSLPSHTWLLRQWFWVRARFRVDLNRSISNDVQR